MNGYRGYLTHYISGIEKRKNETHVMFSFFVKSDAVDFCTSRSSAETGELGIQIDEV